MSSLRDTYKDMISSSGVVVDTTKSRFGGYQEGNAIYRQYKTLGKPDTKTFSEKFVQIIDSVLISGNANLFSKEQEKFFDRYLTQADSGDLTNEMIQFDNFLGGYSGDAV